ncbi:MAG: aminomethyltransferase family protein, partial [Pseudomonadota bacterium]
SDQGRLLGDLSVGCFDDEHFMLFGSGAQGDAHRRWFEQFDQALDCYQNVSDNWHGLALSGPKSRALLSEITDVDVSGEAFSFKQIRQCYVGGYPVILVRLSFSGELGFEIYCAPHHLRGLSDKIERAGQKHHLRWYGARALMSLRLEKSWGVWGLDYRPDFNPLEAGLEGLIDWNKEFVGKKNLLEHKKAPLDKKLVTIMLNEDDLQHQEGGSFDVSNDEAILYQERAVGYVTSGGYAHFVKKSLAMGYVEVEFAKAGQKLHIEICGHKVEGTIYDTPLYDPQGQKMRA